MNLLVLLSGVADPKWPLPAVVDADALRAHRRAHPALSPFDEAALELALKLRDADPATRIEALFVAPAGEDALLRQVTSHRLDRVRALDSAALPPAWDASAFAAAIVKALGDIETDLILMGREFGDEDDGCVPGLLAHELGRSYCSQVLSLEARDGGVRVQRQQADRLEYRLPSLPALVAVVNHAGNRLRHPLLKNVMAARKMTFETIKTDSTVSGQLELAGRDAMPQAARELNCRMIDGDIDTQARWLAGVLRGEKIDV